MSSTIALPPSFAAVATNLRRKTQLPISSTTSPRPVLLTREQALELEFAEYRDESAEWADVTFAAQAEALSEAWPETD